MNKFLVVVLAVTMTMCLFACGKKDETIGEDQVQTTVENNDASDETEPFDASAASVQEDEVTEGTTAYNFKGYTETADWLDENSWAGLGLPNLTMSDDVNGSVHISDKDWIYPLNGSDGVLIECTPSSSQIDAIIADIQNAGIDMTEDSDFYKGYVGTYSFAGNKMKITVSESEIGKLSILVVTNPTD